MEQNKNPVQLPFYARLCMILLSIVLIIVLMYEAKEIIIPLFFSTLIAFLLLPLVKWMERHKLPRSLSAMLSILLFVLVVAMLFTFIGRQITSFSEDLPQLGTRIQEWIKQFQSWLDARYNVDYSHQAAYLNNLATAAGNYASVAAQGFLMAITGFIIWTIFVFIFTFFILTHRALLKRFFIELFSSHYRGRVMDGMLQTRALANSYVLGLMIEMLIVAVLNCIVLLLFGVKYAILLGVIAAVLNIIPYIGIYSATALAAIITLGNSTPAHSLQVIIILLVVHFIDANILLPRIVGSRVKMNPLITVIAVLAGSMLWGIPGMFLFIPLAAILKIVFEKVDGLKPWAILMGTDEEDGKKPITTANTD